MMDRTIPFLDLVTTHRALEEDLVRVFRDALRDARFVGGPEVEGFEREFAEYCGTRHCVGVGSGTDALRFALMAAGVGPGDAVVTVSLTFLATVEAISQCGADTEFVDIDACTCTMSPDALGDYLAACRTDLRTGRPLGLRTGRPIKAIVPVHLYGQVADMDRLAELAARYRLLIVEDAAQAHGAEYLTRRAGTVGAWRRAGTFGTAAAFSFYPGKNLGACGEAGAVTTDDDEVARQVRALRDHGQTKKYHHDVEGYNGRLDAIQAGFLRVKLRRLDGWNSERRAAACRYHDGLAAISPDLHVPVEPEWSRSVYHLYVLRTGNRDGLARHLQEESIQTGLHYPVPVHLQPCYRAWHYQTGSLPVTEQVAGDVLSLPMFPGLTAADQRRIVTEIDAFMAARPLPELDRVAALATAERPGP